MVLPQDSRAPHRQQRWIEIENVGATTIPPFGIVEIADSYRPESTGLVQGDGPTVVKVKKPTIDSLPHFIINGPLEVPAGKRGRIGTNDYPCLCAYDTTNQPVSGDMWGTVANSYSIGRGRQGLAIMGDADFSLGVVRVMRAERLIRVTPYSGPLMPGGDVGCTVLRWNGISWVATSTLIPVVDPLFRTCALQGEEFWCEAYGRSFQTVSEFGLRRRGKVVQQSIQPNSTGLVSFWSITPPPGLGSCTGDREGPVVDVCYRTPSGSSLSVDEELFVHYHPEFRRWFALPVGGGSLIRFEMLTNLPLGGQGTAIEIGTGPAFNRIGAQFPIKDYSTSPGKFRFDPKDPVSLQNRGYMGWCVIPANPQLVNGVVCREIIQMENIARSLEFTLTADLQGTQATATITNYYLDGKDPANTTVMTGSVLRVYDAQGNYPRALQGAKGKARYNDRLHRYEIIECNQMAILIKATCSELCPSQQSTGVSDYAAMTFPPYGQKPVNVTTAMNSNGLAHQGSARDTLVWDESLEQWDILQVPHVPKFVSLYTEIAQSGCTILINSPLIELAVMTCGTLDAHADQIGGTMIEVVTGVERDGCVIEFAKRSLCTFDVEQAGSDEIVFGEKTVVTGSRLTEPTQGDPTCKLELKLEIICVLEPDDVVPAYEDLIDFTPQLAVQYVDFVDGCLVAGTALLYVACFEEGDVEEITCADPCPSGSSSGSGQ